jgi:hypothetical protein
MKKKTIEFEYENEIQLKTTLALIQSFENGSINMDKFILWVLKNYDCGTSICLKLLN